MKRSKFSTSTVVGPERLVPWLAADGPLGYSPENPPVTDYFFQYSWILPGIFEPKENLRHHFYFGIRAKRCETEHIRDRSWLSDTMATQAGLDIGVPGFAQDLWEACHQSFSLEPWVAQRKFGPHYVIFKTPISNIRLTTFFAGEAEARVIDPSLLEVVEATGCKVEAIPARKAKK